MDLAFSLRDSRTWATWPIISHNLDSIVVIHDDKPFVLPPCNSMHAHAKGKLTILTCKSLNLG
jgi:hypothetical protein